MKILEKYAISEKIIRNLFQEVYIKEMSMLGTVNKMFVKCSLKESIAPNTKFFEKKALGHERVLVDYYEKDFVVVVDYYDNATNNEGELLIRIEKFEIESFEELSLQTTKPKNDFHIYYNVEKNSITYKLR